MRLLSNLRVKGKPAVLPDRAIRRQSHYFIYRPRTVSTGGALEVSKSHNSLVWQSVRMRVRAPPTHTHTHTHKRVQV